MKPAPFAYHAPRTVAEALELLHQHGSEAKVLAGGQSLVPLMNFRLVRPQHIVDVNRIDGLRRLGVEGDALTIGALTRQRDVESSPIVSQGVPLLREAVRFIGHPGIRNRGTVGGSLVHADPAAELPLVAAALDAELRLRSVRGDRVLSAEAFFIDYLTTAVQPDELLVEVTVPRPPTGAGWAFLEVARRHGDFALAAVAALLGLDTEGRITWARIALGGVGPVPLRAREVEALLVGESPAEELFRSAASAAAQHLEPDGDVHASAAYRKHLVEVLVGRALRTAAGRAAGLELADSGAYPPPQPSPAREGLGIGGWGLGTKVRPPSHSALSTQHSALGGLPIRVTVNGSPHEASVEPRLSLVDFLRHDLRLTGTHVGCEHGVCGACTVLLDGLAVRSCLLFAAQADGCEVTTVEGLAPPGEMTPLQQAFHEHHALQCGFCTPGMLLSTIDFLSANPSPSETEIREGLSGNLCMCTGYVNIVRAVQAAAAGEC